MKKKNTELILVCNQILLSRSKQSNKRNINLKYYLPQWNISQVRFHEGKYPISVSYLWYLSGSSEKDFLKHKGCS